MEKIVSEISKDYSIVDKNTGELFDYKQTKKVTIDEFIMVFFASYPELFKLKGVPLKVLMCCWKRSSYNPMCEEEGNIVCNNTSFKEACREYGLDTSDANIDNAISLLAKRNLLIKRCRGEYLLNPKYFFKGSLSSRSKLDLHFVVEPTNLLQKKIAKGGKE